MWSRKVEPWAAVMRTLIQSDRTCVPPVTADRSPPASRITGADSPVMAASLTEATPSITSPSEGMMSPASTRTMSPDLEARAGHKPVGVALAPGEELGLGLGAGPAQRVGLRLAAPFRDGLGEVGEQNGEPEPQDDLDREAEVGAAGDEVTDEESRDQGAHDLDHEHDRVLDQDPRVELAERRADGGPEDLGVEQAGVGQALAKLGTVPWENSAADMTDCGRSLSVPAKVWPAIIARCSTTGPSARAGKKVSPPTIRMTPTRRPTNRPPSVGKVPAEGGSVFLAASEPAIAMAGMITKKRPTSIATRAGQIVEQGVAREPRKGRSVVAGLGAVGVEDLGEAMRPRVAGGRDRARHDRRHRRPTKHHQGQAQDGEHRHLDLLGLELLAEILRRAPDHEAGHEHGDDHEDQHAVETRAHAADDDLAELDVDQRDHAAERP